MKRNILERDVIVARRAIRDTIRLRTTLAWLHLRNRFSSASALGNVPVIVSVTSHGKRIRNLWYALESIARGTQRPAQIMVWLDASLRGTPLPVELERFQTRGVEFKYVQDVGPHAKYYYAVDKALNDGLSLATIDDDTIYWSWWLRRLLAAAAETPDIIICYRARRFCVTEDGQPAPYVDWPLFFGNKPEPSVFFTGVSGVLYPRAFLEHLQRFGDGFLESCPRADDVWLNYVASRTRMAARQVFFEPWGFPEVPDTQDIALWTHNASGGNDAQIQATYDAETLFRLLDSRHE